MNTPHKPTGWKFNPTLSFDGVTAFVVLITAAVGYGMLYAQVQQSKSDIQHLSAAVESENQAIYNLKTSVEVLTALQSKQFKQ